MKPNIRRLSISYRLQEPGRHVLDLQIQNTTMEDPMSFYFHTDNHIYLFASYLRDQVPSLERLAFEDVSMILGHVTEQGFCITSSNRWFNVDWFTLPAIELAKIVDRLIVTNQDDTFVVSDDVLKAWSIEYAPVVETRFGDNASGDQIPQDDGFKQCLQRMEGVASACSNGLPVIINIHDPTFGGQEWGYHIYDTANDRRVASGAVFNHGTAEKPDWRIHG